MLGVRLLPGLPLLDGGGLAGLDVGPWCQICVLVLFQLDHLLVIPLGVPVDLQAPVGKPTLRTGLDLRPTGLADYVFLLAAVDGGSALFRAHRTFQLCTLNSNLLVKEFHDKLGDGDVELLPITTARLLLGWRGFPSLRLCERIYCIRHFKLDPTPAPANLIR